MRETLTTFALIGSFMIGATPGAAASEAAREQAAANFLQADGNADGALTFDEFTTLIDLNARDGIGRAKMVRRFGKHGMAFDRLDANGDDLVTPEEIKTHAEQAKR
ncbi:MAG: hypothetical protein AAGC57_09370 [Pseudomonadota bacterium]